MSYTRIELKEIADNIEEYRLSNKVVESFYTDRFGAVIKHTPIMSGVYEEQMHQTAKDLYMKSNGCTRESCKTILI